MSNTTTAHAAGLISFYVHPNDINKHNDVHYARIYFAADVDEMLQKKDRQIAELVAALKNLLGAENAFDEIAAIKNARHTLNALSQHTAPQADTAATAGNDDAVIAWIAEFRAISMRTMKGAWQAWSESDRAGYRNAYADHMREQSKGSES